jgi:hypothetical protein
VDGKNEKKLSGLAIVDETQEYRLDSSVAIAQQRTVTTYKPKVMVSYPKATPITLEGSIKIDNSKLKQTLDSTIVLKGIKDDPITIESMYELCHCITNVQTIMYELLQV